jgi:hypothetical protein
LFRHYSITSAQPELVIIDLTAGQGKDDGKGMDETSGNKSDLDFC